MTRRKRTPNPRFKKHTGSSRRRTRKRTLKTLKTRKRTRKRTSKVKVRKLFGGNVSIDLKPNVEFYLNDDNVKELRACDFVGNVVTHPSFKGKHGIIMWYADWCPHCNSPETQKLWRDFAKICKNKVVVGAINCANTFYGNDEVAQTCKIHGYPTITYVGKDGVINVAKNTFSTQRTLYNLKTFINEKVGTTLLKL